jgi:glycogen debranching enzyme
VLENRRAAHPPADLQAPIRDYKMVDGDFLLAPVLVSYLLDTPQGQARAAAFLARKTTNGETYAAQIRKNLDLVLQQAAPFAAEPKFANLIALRDGVPVGNWRDSNNGLGGGRYAFDINVALVPAALKAADRLYRSGLLGDAQQAASQAARYGDAWKDTARFFAVTVPADTARKEVAAYAADQGLDGSAAVASITGAVKYDAVSLDADGKPVPVMHSDSGFVLLFGDPAPAYLDAVAAQIVRPFPAGLRTSVGLVVANPAYAPDAVKQLFTRKDYHGTVVWSWQQAMLASGLKRQLARTDLPAGTRAALKEAQRALWQGILAMRERSSGELWGWQPRNGKAVLTMWDSAEGDEACAAQLWSTVYLAIKPPEAE